MEKQKVKLCIKGLDDIDAEYIGYYYEKDQEAYVFYEEMLEGYSQAFKSRLQIKPGRVVLRRQGAEHTTEMVFDEGEPQVLLYHTPVGALELIIETKQITIKKPENPLFLLKPDFQTQTIHQMLVEIIYAIKEPQEDGSPAMGELSPEACHLKLSITSQV